MINLIIDALEEQIALITDVRDTGPYQFTLRLTDRLVVGGMPIEDAEKVASSIKTDIDANSHKDHPVSFDRVLDLFSEVILRIWIAAKSDYTSPTAVVLALCAQMEVIF